MGFLFLKRRAAAAEAGVKNCFKEEEIEVAPCCVPRKKGIKPMPPDSNRIEFAGLWFRWDLDKAASNYGKHRVRFEQAVRVFGDDYAREVQNKEVNYEERWRIVGEVNGRLLVVAYAYRRVADGVEIRIISARTPEPWERREYERRKYR